MTTNELLIRLILYGILPIWGISGFIDWLCHRATKIETTSGLKESLLHSVMGIQLGVPIVLGLFFQINFLIILISFVALLMHEVAAHSDVHYAAPRRHISIWEMHVHNYMATLPLYLFLLILVLNWPVVEQVSQGNWTGQWSFIPLATRYGGNSYLTSYLLFMLVLCVFPYLEENIRCWRAQRNQRGADS